MPASKETMRLSAKTLSPGLGAGNAYVHRDALQRHDEFYEIDTGQVEAELARFKEASSHVADDLERLAGQVEEQMDAGLSDVFRAHATMLQDASLKDEMEKEIRRELVSAGSAVRTVFRRWEQRFRNMEAEVARQKGDDLRDLSRRFISALAGVRGHALEDIPQDCVLIAHRLLPSDTVYLARNKAKAVILEKGGVGSHAALFAREIGLPCIAGLENVLEQVEPGKLVLVDADAGEVVVNPSPEEADAFARRQRETKRARSEARAKAQEPAVTSDGRRIRVFANVGGVEDTLAALENGAEGLGLYRIEQAYLGRQQPPETEELLHVLRETLEPAKALPVHVRLLDAGADKPLPFMEQLAEQNPALGLRGIRFLKHYPKLAETQAKALIALAEDFDLHILVPMATLPDDLRWIKKVFHEQADKAGLKKKLRIGAMIETPAAALASRELAEQADFLSFGTNDLTQYAFAADRENAAVDAYFNDTHAAVFRMMAIVHADLPDLPLSLCGELAGRADQMQRILESGITTLSVAPPSIPEIKQAVRECDQR